MVANDTSATIKCMHRLSLMPILLALGCTSYSTPPIVGPRAVASLEKIHLGGVDQFVLLRGRDRQNPLLLRLHGGPGQAEMAAESLNRALEEAFVVIEWDQRGAGKSAAAIEPLSSMTLAQIVDDTVELTRVLAQRFGQRKVLLMGHSWGSVVGLQAVQKAPDLYSGIITTGQIVQVKSARQITYAHLLQVAQSTGNAPAEEELKNLGPPPYNGPGAAASQKTYSSWVEKLGASWHSTQPFDRVRLMMRASEYAWPEKLRYTGAAERSFAQLRPDLDGVDLFGAKATYQVPVVFFLGRYDYLAPTELAERYMKTLQAPFKQIVWFAESAHFPQYEEPEHFAEQVRAAWESFQRIRPATDG